MTENREEIKAAPRRWFRFYAESVNDPKIQRLPAHQFKTWINLLCLASSNGGKLPRRDDIAFQLRMSDHDAQVQLDDLIGIGLLDILPDGGIEPHNWKGRQYVADSSAGRVQKYRDKRKAAGLPMVSDYSRFKPELIARDGEACAYCASTDKLVVDHMMPISQGGVDDIDNLCLACKGCNSGKAGRTPEQAGYKFVSKTAQAAFLKHTSAVTKPVTPVTVTVTSPDTEQIQSRAESDQIIPPTPQGGEAEDQAEPVVLKNGMLSLNNRLWTTWVDIFKGDKGRLILALTEVAGRIQPNSSRPLEAQVSSQLARIAGDRHDRDRRYDSAVKLNVKQQHADKPISGVSAAVMAKVFGEAHA